MPELFAAHREWADRPQDERFSSFEDLLQSAQASREASRELLADWTDFVVGKNRAGEMVLGSKAAGGSVKLTEWSLGQVAWKLQAPKAYIGRLSPDVAAMCLNEDLVAMFGEQDAAPAKMLVKDGRLLGLTSPSYARIWDADVLGEIRSLGLEEDGWTLPMGYANGDWGAPLAPSGAYRGDRSMFLFMVNESAKIDDGSSEGLSRGFFVWNSEVGARTFGVSTFLYRHVCGNNIVWGASEVSSVKFRHVGATLQDRAFAELRLALSEYASASAYDDEAAIRRAQVFQIAPTREEVTEKVAGWTGIGKRTVEAIYSTGEAWESVDGNPMTGWGMVNAISRYSQGSKWVDDRAALDASAGVLMTRVSAF